ASLCKVLDAMAEQIEGDTSAAFVKAAEAMKSSTASMNEQNTQLAIVNRTFGMSTEATNRFIASEQRLAVESSKVSATLKAEALAAIDRNEQLQLAKTTNEEFAAS